MMVLTFALSQCFIVKLLKKPIFFRFYVFICNFLEFPSVKSFKIFSVRDYFVNHSYDYRPNWTPLGAITIINRRSK